MLPHRYGRKMGIKELIKNKTDKKNVSDSQRYEQNTVWYLKTTCLPFLLHIITALTLPARVGARS